MTAESSIRSRLLNGARLLGQLWRKGERCSVSEFSCSCHCPLRSQFCKAKVQWVKLAEQDTDRPESVTDHPHGRFCLLETMRLSEFRATGLPLRVETGSGQVLKVGPKGSSPEALLGLDSELTRAVEKVLEVFPEAVVTEVSDVPVQG